MAKKKKQSEDIRYAVNKKALKKARAQAAEEQAQLEKRMENREKSRRMGSAFLYGVVTLIVLFCLYTLLRTLFVRRASSLETLRGELLFVSLAAIPMALGLGAVLVHRLLKNRREKFSDRGRRLSNLLFLLVLIGAFVLFGVQLRGSRADGSAHPAYTQTLRALEQSGLETEAPDSVDRIRTLLEDSVQADLTCGGTAVRVNYHAGRLPGLADRFLDQTAWDYEDFPRTETGGATLWGPKEGSNTARAALCLQNGNAVTIWELNGPAEEVETLLPLLSAAFSAQD